MHLMHLMHLLITFVAVFSLSSSSSHVAATCLTSTMTAGEAIDCSGEILVGEELAFKDLMGANFKGAYIAHTNFAGANLTSANFDEAVLHQVTMKDAQFTGVSMKRARLIKVVDLDATRSDLRGSKCEECHIKCKECQVADSDFDVGAKSKPRNLFEIDRSLMLRTAVAAIVIVFGILSAGQKELVYENLSLMPLRRAVSAKYFSFEENEEACSADQANRKKKEDALAEINGSEDKILTACDVNIPSPAKFKKDQEEKENMDTEQASSATSATKKNDSARAETPSPAQTPQSVLPLAEEKENQAVDGKGTSKNGSFRIGGQRPLYRRRVLGNANTLPAPKEFR